MLLVCSFINFWPTGCRDVVRALSAMFLTIMLKGFLTGDVFSEFKSVCLESLI